MLLCMKILISADEDQRWYANWDEEAASDFYLKNKPSLMLVYLEIFINLLPGGLLAFVNVCVCNT